MSAPKKKAPDDDPDDDFWNNPDNFRDPPGGMDATNLDQGAAYPIQTANPGQANPNFEMPPESLYQGIPQNYQMGPPNPNPVRPQNQTGTSQMSRFRPPPDAYLFTSDLYTIDNTNYNELLQMYQGGPGASQRQGQPVHPYAYDPNFAQQRGGPGPMRTQQQQRQFNWPYQIPENRSSQGNFSFDAPDDIICVYDGRFQTGQIGLRQQAPQNYPPNVNQQGRYDQPSSNYNQNTGTQSNPQNTRNRGHPQNPYPVIQNQQYGARLSFAPSDGAPNLPRFPQPIETHGLSKRRPITEKEVELLRDRIKNNRWLNAKAKAQIAKQLGLDQDIVDTWYKEERERLAKQNREKKVQIRLQRFEEEEERYRQNQRLVQRAVPTYVLTNQVQILLLVYYHYNPRPSDAEIAALAGRCKIPQEAIRHFFHNQYLASIGQYHQMSGPQRAIPRYEFTDEMQMLLIVPNNGQQVSYQNPYETRRFSQPSIQNIGSEWNVTQQGQPSSSNQPNPSNTSSGNGSTAHRTVEDATRERLRARLSLNEEQRNGQQIPPKSYPQPKNKDNTNTEDSSKDEKNPDSDKEKETKNSKERK